MRVRTKARLTGVAPGPPPALLTHIMHRSDEAEGQAAVEEVQWTDDSIRWEGGLRVKTTDGGEAGNDDDASSEEEDYLVDPFK